LLWSRRVIIGLGAFSIVMNSLATIAWLVDADQNVSAETKLPWKTVRSGIPMGNESENIVTVGEPQRSAISRDL